MSIVDLSPVERVALDDFCTRVRAFLGARVRELKLFGSRARGDSHEDSDIDVCVVIDDLDWKEKHSVWGIAGEILTDHDVLLSPLVMSTAHMAHLRARELLIAREIAAEGIAL
jgi:predicted nucleotidyltransferase